MDKEVATSAYKEIKVATSVRSRDIMSKRVKVVTTFSYRDISRTDEEVATSLSCRDIRCKGIKVATSVSCRDINCKDLRSRQHSVVATSVMKNSGCDISQLSRHQFSNGERSQQQSEVATSATQTRRSRHQIQRVKVATSRSGRDTRS